VKLARKLQKLFTAEAFASFREHAQRLTHPVDANPLLVRLDRAAWIRLQEKYPRAQADIHRFANVEYWIRINIERAQDLWLDRAAPLQILDLGCGPGYFLYVCRQLGHGGVGLDVDNVTLFRETTALLEVPRVIWRIEPHQKLPPFDRKFDLVTAHRICFHQTYPPGGNFPDGEWTSDDWQFFIDDIREHVLAPNGHLLLDFNPRDDGRTFFTPQLRSLLHENGARIFRSKALLSINPSVTPRFKSTRVPSLAANRSA
jgi:SAM-dependent methyltransferase